MQFDDPERPSQGIVLSPLLQQSSCLSCLQIDYPEIEEGTKPRHRFMSAYEQRKEAQDKKYQFLLFAADPYEVIAFKIPNSEVDRSDRLFSYWYDSPPDLTS